jgi:hypothetical protein
MHSGKKGYANNKITGLVKHIKAQDNNYPGTTTEVDG